MGDSMSSNKIDYAKKGWKAVITGLAIFGIVWLMFFLAEQINENWLVTPRTVSYLYAITTLCFLIATGYFLLAALNKKTINIIFFIIALLITGFLLYAMIFSYYYT